MSCPCHPTRHFRRTSRGVVEESSRSRRGVIGRAYEIDKGNGNTLWHDTIKKEMTNVGIPLRF